MKTPMVGLILVLFGLSTAAHAANFNCYVQIYSEDPASPADIEIKDLAIHLGEFPEQKPIHLGGDWWLEELMAQGPAIGFFLLNYANHFYLKGAGAYDTDFIYANTKTSYGLAWAACHRKP